MTTMLGIDLRGRRVLLAGGGSVAGRRAETLLAEGAALHVVAPELGERLTALVEAGAATWRGGAVREEDLDGAWLVHTATGSAATDAAVAAWAATRATFCIVASAAEAGTARMTASARVDDVVLGVVSAGSPDPLRSVAVRDALAEGLRSGEVAVRRRRRGGQGRVVLVGGGPGAVDLLTVRGRKALADADVVVTDRLGATGVLDELPDDVEVIDVGKRLGHHPVPQDGINRILVERALAGQRVVRLKGGDPFVYGRGGEEVLACRAAGIEVEVVPGISSALSVPAAAGIPLTHRGVATSAHIVNGQDALTDATLEALRDPSVTTVFLMGVSPLAERVERMLAEGVPADTPVAIVERGWTPSQRTTRARLDRIVAVGETAGVRSPAIVVVGAVAAERFLEPQRSPQEVAAT